MRDCGLRGDICHGVSAILDVVMLAAVALGVVVAAGRVIMPDSKVLPLRGGRKAAMGLRIEKTWLVRSMMVVGCVPNESGAKYTFVVVEMPDSS